MNVRLRELRKALNLSQGSLGHFLGVSNTAISKLEKGENNITDQNIKALCREFNVSEHWFRTGDGEMFTKLSKDEEFDRVCLEIQLSNDEFIKSIMRKYWALDEEKKAIIRSMLANLPEK